MEYELRSILCNIAGIFNNVFLSLISVLKYLTFIPLSGFVISFAHAFVLEPKGGTYQQHLNS